jgi:hypothetical protein
MSDLSELKVGKLAQIRYTKDGEGEGTERYVVPTVVPSNIKALDVSGLPEPLRAKIADCYSEYADYIKQHMRTAFSFEDWLQHSQQITIEPKWRTFKPDNTEIL